MCGDEGWGAWTFAFGLIWLLEQSSCVKRTVWVKDPLCGSRQFFSRCIESSLDSLVDSNCSLFYARAVLVWRVTIPTIRDGAVLDVMGMCRDALCMFWMGRSISRMVAGSKETA